MSDALLDMATLLQERMPAGVNSTEVTPAGELVLHVDANSLPDIVEFLKQDRNLRFSTLIDITAVDYPEREKRFDLVYHFLSMYTNARVRLKAEVAEGQIAPSITWVHPSANWFEREVFDMFGILFSGHPDLRRLLTDYGFRGNPLRKDFPTTGYVEVRYDESEKRVVYEPVKLTQEYRQFDFMSPWEGAEYILPGDENADQS
ncbi:MAG: NADH-quinone oxidoreductase subunit C [Pseudomonadota bacterium]